MLIETNLNKLFVSISKMLSQDAITRNLKWVLTNAFSPPEKEKQLSHIIEYPDGKVEIKFEDEPLRFPIFKVNLNIKKFMSSKPSASSI